MIPELVLVGEKLQRVWKCKRCGTINLNNYHYNGIIHIRPFGGYESYYLGCRNNMLDNHAVSKYRFSRDMKKKALEVKTYKEYLEAYAN